MLRTPILFPVIVTCVAVFVAALLASAKTRRAPGHYVGRKLLTNNELEFFERLAHALPGHYIFPQVAMSALLESSSRDRRQAYRDHLRIAQHRVDYVICDTRCNVICVVELDDKTHSRSKDELRDNRLKQGGVRTVRFQSRNKPSVEVIRASILQSEITEPPHAGVTVVAHQPEQRTPS